MRYVLIDLSSDNHLQQPQIFGGYAGEHNETILRVKLPKRMININCSGYRFDFQTSDYNKISSPLIPPSELNEDYLSFHLAEQLTISGKLLFNVVAISTDGDLVSLIAKTNMVILHISDSAEGNIQTIDPNSYKDDLQKMIDYQVEEALKNPSNYRDELQKMVDEEVGELFENVEFDSVDQSFDSNSSKAQSGTAVAEAIKNKQEKLISGENISSINGKSLLDGGNIEIESPTIDQTYNPESENAQSGKAMAEAIGNIEIPDVDLSSKMDKFGEVIETDELIEVDLEQLTEDNSSKPIRFRFGDNAYIESAEHGISFKLVAGDNVIDLPVGGKTGLYLHGMPIHNVGVWDSPEDDDVANVGYVNKMCIPERDTYPYEGYMGLENNKEYIIPNEVSSVKFGFPNGTDIRCSLIFTTSTEGDINITFQEDLEFIGGTPQFGNGEAWEINIKNGIATAHAINNCASKAIGDIETVLDELHNYAEKLKGGTVSYIDVTLADSETGTKYTLTVSNGKVILEEVE